jgi:predicted RNase H-like HicB family nuclease
LKKKRTYTLVITRDPRNKRTLNVNVPEILGCYTFGMSRAQAIKNGKEVIRMCLESEDHKECYRGPAKIIRVRM